MIKPTVSYPVIQHSQQILSALNNITPELQKISGVKTAISLIKERTGIDLFEKQGLKINDGSKIISLFTPDKFTLLIKIQDLINKETRELQIKNSIVSGSKSAKEDIGTLLESILDTIDFPILKLRRFFAQGELSTLIEKLSPKAKMNTKCTEIAEELKTLFQEIHTALSSIPDNYTKIKIRNGYPAITSGQAKSRQLDFQQIGIPKRDYSINFIKDRKNTPLLVISIQESENSAQHIIINPDNQAMKEVNINRIYHFGDKTAYYSQSELDSWDFKDKLTTLRDELVKYKDYLGKSISVKNSVREFYSTSEAGCIDKESLKLIKNIKTLFDACKAKMLKIKDAPRKDAFKKRYKIDTIMSSPSLIFKNTSQTGESIHLSFPKLNGEICTKILIVSQNNDIKKSYFIQNDKLVKFNASSLGRSKRQDTVTNYYSQEDIDNSGLREVLGFLKSRLSVIKT